MKLRHEALKRLISKVWGEDPSVLVPPKPGEDAAVLDLGGGNVLVVHPDPITGAVKYLGRLAVYVPTNDIAVEGGYPRYVTMTLILPEEAGEETALRVAEDSGKAAEELGISIVGGHTEFSDSVTRPLAVVTAIGFSDTAHITPTSAAMPGDLIIMGKSAAMEAAAIIATDFRERLEEAGVAKEVIEEAAGLIEKISLVREAWALASRRLVRAMHDPTEGGLLGGIAEMADASGLSAIIDASSVIVSDVVKEVLGAVGVDPLRSLSSGTLVAAAPREKVGEALAVLESMGVEASIIGEFTWRRNWLVKVVGGEEVTYIDEPFVEDEVMALWERSAP